MTTKSNDQDLTYRAAAPLTRERVRELLAEGRELRADIERVIDRMRTPTPEEAKAKAR